MSMNKTRLMGRIATDFTERATKKGDKVVRFALAVDHTYDKGSDLFNITVFDNSARNSKLATNLITYNAKGDEIYVEARMVSGSYVDKNGVTQYTTDLLATSVEYVSTALKNRKGSQQADPKGAPKANQPAEEVSVADDDLPF